MREVDACACIPTRTSRVDVMSATAMHTWQQAMSRNQCMLMQLVRGTMHGQDAGFDPDGTFNAQIADKAATTFWSYDADSKGLLDRADLVSALGDMGALQGLLPKTIGEYGPLRNSAQIRYLLSVDVGARNADLIHNARSTRPPAPRHHTCRILVHPKASNSPHDRLLLQPTPWLWTQRPTATSASRCMSSSPCTCAWRSCKQSWVERAGPRGITKRWSHPQVRDLPGLWGR